MKHRCLIVWLLALGPVVAQDKSADVYRRDIEFFLDAFEEQAGHFFEEKKIDWNDVRHWALDELRDVQSDADHLRLCARLLARLRDGHARLKDCNVVWPDESEGRTWCRPAMGMLVQGEELLVVSTDPSLGIPPGTAIKAIDGKPAMEWLEERTDKLVERRGFSTRRHALFQTAVTGLGGWEGSGYEIRFRRPDGTDDTRTVDHRPKRVLERLDFSKQLEDLHPVGRNAWARTKKGNGFLRIRKVPADLPDQIDRMLGELGDVPGMIVDMRGNGGGGCDHNAVISRFVGRGEFWGLVEGQGEHPFTGPVVVIIDAMTASAGETLAGQFGEDQRALVIGPSATAGMSSQKTTIKAPSGLCSAYFSVRSNKKRFNRGRGVEGIGIKPHIVVPYHAEDLAEGIDTQIKRAEELLAKRTWPEWIDWGIED